MLGIYQIEMHHYNWILQTPMNFNKIEILVILEKIF